MFPDPSTLKPIETPISKSQPKFLYLVVVMITLGIISGFSLSVIKKSSSKLSPSTITKYTETDTVKGSTDKKTFRDSATGTIEAGGIDGEGTHKLIRTGGPSQTVYLVSSVLDLSEYEGKKVEVWGETHKASKAPWLMDVGLVKILE